MGSGQAWKRSRAFKV
uniref:Uncharacterized protein n=1 Tax=Vitis vinifera TaxID=29760 RepID=F6H805_VITVI